MVQREWCEESRDKLKEAKCYLKSSYCANCCDDMENLCADHCREHALSDRQYIEFTSPCTHVHAEQYKNCDLLRNTMSSTLSEVRESQDVQFYSTDQQEDLLYDAVQAWNSILSGRPTFSEQQIRIVPKQML